MGSIPGTCKCQDLYSLFFVFKWMSCERSSELFLIGTDLLTNTCFCSVFTEQNILIRYSFCVGGRTEKRPIDTIWSLDCKDWLSETNAALWKRQLNLSTEKDSFILFLFALSSNWGESFTPLPSASVLRLKEGEASAIISWKTSFILWDTLSQVKVQLPQNPIQYMKYCGVGENDTVRQYKC